MMNFSEALYLLRQGRKIKRSGWEDKCLKIVGGHVAVVISGLPWEELAELDGVEILANDWIVVD